MAMTNSLIRTPSLEQELFPNLFKSCAEVHQGGGGHLAYPSELLLSVIQPICCDFGITKGRVTRKIMKFIQHLSKLWIQLKYNSRVPEGFKECRILGVYISY